MNPFGKFPAAGMSYASDSRGRLNQDTPKPLPITTGIKMSERFQSMQTPGQSQHKLAWGGFGYGGPSESNFSFGRFSDVRHGNSNNYNVSQSDRNKLLAQTLGQKANALLLQSRSVGLRARGSGIQRGFGIHRNFGLHPVNRGFNVSVHNRIGLGRGGNGYAGRTGPGGFGMTRGFFRRGLHTPVTGPSRTARGGGRGRFGNGRGRGGNSGLSPIKRGAAGAGSLNSHPSFGPTKTKDLLDKEIDIYMSQSKSKKKLDLDKELDEYMRIAREQAAASLTTTTTTAAASGSTDINLNVPQEEDINMTEDA